MSQQPTTNTNVEHPNVFWNFSNQGKFCKSLLRNHAYNTRLIQSTIIGCRIENNYMYKKNQVHNWKNFSNICLIWSGVIKIDGFSKGKCGKITWVISLMLKKCYMKLSTIFIYFFFFQQYTRQNGKLGFLNVNHINPEIVCY